MRTLKEAQERRDELISFGMIGDDKQKSSARRKLKILAPIIMYLESNPNEGVVAMQLETESKLLESIEGEFALQYPRGCLAEQKQIFMKDKGYSEIRSKIKHLEIILNKKDI